VLPDMDFENYSEAGWVFNAAKQKWEPPKGVTGNKRGLELVGAAVYTEHPTADVLSLYYDLKDGHGRRHWRPGLPPPLDLWCHVEGGGVIEAWNSSFEHWVWVNILVPKYDWPTIGLRQFRCAMAKARAHGLPGGLEAAGDVLKIANRKDADGKRLLAKFSRPRNPTKTDPRLRVLPTDDPDDARRLYAYNEGDILAEAETSSLTPDLSPEELEFWFCDQEINFRGVAVDTKAIADCINIIEQAYERYNTELANLTGGQVQQASQLERLKGWLIPRGVYLHTADEDAIDEQLKRTDLDPAAKRALEIRGLVGSASVKKLYALALQTTAAGRVHDLFSYHAARTGRATGNGPQPHNLPKSGA
jgi:DNA polymerase